MRVAVVCPYDLGLFGGVQQLTIELVDRLAASGHDAWLVGPGVRNGAVSVGRTVKMRANASVVPLALGSGVARAVREAVDGADVVHVHEPLMPRVGTAASGLSMPRVLTFHADAPGWAHRFYRAAPVRHRMRESVLTAVSPVAARALPPAWGPVTIVPNAIDTAAYAVEVERVATRVTFLGRDDPRKGLDVLLRAWPTVVERVPGAELVVMGAKRTAGQGVRYLGRVAEDDKRATLASAAVHVAPNTGGESFGIVLAEAMAAGAAVVASDIPAFRAVVGDAGALVPVGDSAALADAVVGLLTNQAALERAAVAGRRRVRDFDWSVVVGRYVDAYAAAVG